MIFPADLRLTGGDFVSIDHAALTGESQPITKKTGDEAYSGSVVKQGEMGGVACLGRASCLAPISSAMVRAIGTIRCSLSIPGCGTGC
jgi:cation transport ATPase